MITLITMHFFIDRPPLTLYSAEEDGPLEAYGLGTFLSVV